MMITINFTKAFPQQKNVFHVTYHKKKHQYEFKYQVKTKSKWEFPMLLYLYIMVSDLMGGEVGDSIKLDLCLFEI